MTSAAVAYGEHDSGSEAETDFVQFLCGRFQVDRERGMALFSTLLDDYVPSVAYPIHTLELPGNDET
jgi:hypothetical protein